jgi:cyclomaltodextrinase / maltogenic alpha-amylase / neopullulanase
METEKGGRVSSATHHSRLPLYRQPQGAAAEGADILLRLIATDIESCSVMVDGGSGWAETPMRPTARDGKQVYEAVINAPGPGWLFYYFSLKTAQGAKYLCAPHDGLGGEGIIQTTPGEPWQITIHMKDFHTPDWAKGAIIYQIFPDRFCCGDYKKARQGLEYHAGMGRKVFPHENWGEEPLYLPLPGEKEYIPCDYYLGDLKGITEKLEHIAQLGATIIYLNPIFEAASNHRYNTADYHRIDPVLGDWTDFTALCNEARKRGIRIMLDGVFSHTGDDSIYFNRTGNYPSQGAWQGPGSPYYSWYKFKSMQEYSCWWNMPSLPETNELDPGYMDFIAGEKGVAQACLEYGASGFRLDVADELPEPFIARLRIKLKACNPDAFLLGEVWEDATKKYSYGERRRYLLGGGLDAVMNYPLREALLNFLTEHTDAGTMHRQLMSLWENYPMPTFYSAMNLLSSHDVERIRTRLGGAPDMRSLTRQEQARVTLNDSQLELADKRLRLITLLQYCIPGNPSIYYGDEAGMTGMGDPFNRRTYPWGKEDGECLAWYKWLAWLRQNNPVLTTGLFAACTIDPDVYTVYRFTSSGKDAFGKEMQGAIVCIVNRSAEEKTVTLSIHEQIEGRHGEFITQLADVTFTDVLTHQEYAFQNGRLILQLQPLGWVVLAGKE